MSAHKDHHHVAVTIDGDQAGPVVVWFRWRWQAWAMHLLLGRAVAGQRRERPEEPTPGPCSEHTRYVPDCPLCNLQDQLEEDYRTPAWERILLAGVLVLLALVVVSAIASIIVPTVRA